MAFAVSRDNAVISKMIDGIAKRSKSLTTDIQITAISCILHAIEHRDVTLAARLYDAVSRAGNRRSLAAFFAKNGPIIVSTKNNAAGEAVANFKLDVPKADKLKDTDLELLAEALKTQPWQDTEKESTFNGFNLKAEVVKLLKRAEAIQKDEARKSHEKNDFTGIAELRNLAGHVANAA